jgi:hypothetical protein
VHPSETEVRRERCIIIFAAISCLSPAWFYILGFRVGALNKFLALISVSVVSYALPPFFPLKLTQRTSSLINVYYDPHPTFSSPLIIFIE